MSAPLHIKYRPADLDSLIGQDAVCTNLARLFVAKRVPHTFLFTGPSGTGKTTLARIVARMLDCKDQGITEVDAARFSGIDAMRELLTNTKYAGLGESPNRFLIIDEAHALSKAAWQTLLLSCEEPPEHLYFAFCTTEADKVPQTIRTRSHTYDLKPVQWDELAGYLNMVREEEQLKVKEEFIDLAARKASGSVRQGLVFLSLLDGITDRKEALRLLDEASEATDGPIALARMIVSGKGFAWPAARKLLEGMQDSSPESIRLVVVNYAASAMLKTESEKEVQKLCAILDAFSKPCHGSEKFAPVLLAIGALLYG